MEEGPLLATQYIQNIKTPGIINSLSRGPDCISVHCTVYSVQCSVFIAVYSVPFASLNRYFGIYCTVYSVQYKVYTVQCTIYSLQYARYTEHCKKFIGHCTLYTIHCTLYTIDCTPQTVHRTLYNVRCSLHTAHGSLYKCTMYAYISAHFKRVKGLLATGFVYHFCNHIRISRTHFLRN